jgi:hypothetical protein
VGGETYTATTDALGDARVGLPVVLPAGAHSVRIVFAADSHYLGSEATATVTVGQAPPATLLVVDADSIQSGARFHPTGGTIVSSGPSFFRSHDVHGARATATHRLVPRYFAENVGATITLATGQTGDEGWFAPTCIPQRWLGGNGSGCLAGAARDDAIDRYFGDQWAIVNPSQQRLENVPAVIPLRARGLASLVGATVCAVVYADDVSVNYSSSSFPFTHGNLKGATLGVVAFDVTAVRRLRGFSSSTLPEVQLTIRATSRCGGSWALLDAPVPQSSSVPNDVDPARPATGYRTSVQSGSALSM